MEQLCLLIFHLNKKKIKINSLVLSLYKKTFNLESFYTTFFVLFFFDIQESQLEENLQRVPETPTLLTNNA